MRIKVTRGGEPLKLLDYLFDPKKQLETVEAELQRTGNIQNIVICRTVPGRTVSELAHNFKQVARLNPKVDKVIAHYSISLPIEDSVQVEQAAMYEISRMLLKQLGHGRCPYVGVEHHDTNHRHWHLAASTVDYDGMWVGNSFDRYRIRQLEKDLELRFSLKQTQTRPTAAVRNLSTGEYRQKRRTGRLLPKERLWAALDECLPMSTSLTRLVMELRVKYPDISIQLKEKAGAHVGISFAVDGVAFSGGKLGRAYSLNGLRRYHGVQHRADSKELVDEILALPLAECKSLYQDMEERLRIEHEQSDIEVEPRPQLEF